MFWKDKQLEKNSRYVSFSKSTAKINPKMIAREYKIIIEEKFGEVKLLDVKLDDPVHAWVDRSYMEPFDMEFVHCVDMDGHDGIHRPVLISDLNALVDKYALQGKKLRAAKIELEEVELEYKTFRAKYRTLRSIWLQWL